MRASVFTVSCLMGWKETSEWAVFWMEKDIKYFFFFLFAPSFSFCLLIHIHVYHEADLWDMQVGNKMKKH